VTYSPGESPWPEFGSENPVSCILPEGCRTDGKVIVLHFILNAGMGNQLFEFAAGYGIAKRLKLPFVWSWRSSELRQFELTHFGIPEQYFPAPLVASRLGQGNIQIVRKAEELILNSPERFCGVSSPFQAEECFADVADEIRQLYEIDPYPLALSNGNTPVAVQVRRGDYLGHSRLDVVTFSYFLHAMSAIRRRIEHPMFFILSDDPEWCVKAFGHLRDTVIVTDQSPLVGMRTMVACQAHVISNSTYGWWGAWLGEKGLVVVPEMWHKPTRSYGNWNPVPDRWKRGKLHDCGMKIETIPVRDEEIMPPPDDPRAIVYPYNADQEQWHELRFSMRSIDKFFEDKKCPIYIIGTRRPPWLLYSKSRVQFISEWSYRNALVKGVQLADKILWMNDDIMLLKPTTWADVERTLYVKEVGPDFLENAPVQNNSWRAAALHVLRLIAADGIFDQLVYSTHTPYVYEREKALEVLKKFAPFSKFPFELAYFHYHAKDPTRITGLRTHGIPFGDFQFLNFTDYTLTTELKQALAKLLPDYAPWELQAKFQI